MIRYESINEKEEYIYSENLREVQEMLAKKDGEGKLISSTTYKGCPAIIAKK